MSWFKSRKNNNSDTDDKSANASTSKVTRDSASSTSAHKKTDLDAGAASFADARRALQASLNLEGTGTPEPEKKQKRAEAAQPSETLPKQENLLDSQQMADIKSILNRLDNPGADQSQVKAADIQIEAPSLADETTAEAADETKAAEPHDIYEPAATKSPSVMQKLRSNLSLKNKSAKKTKAASKAEADTKQINADKTETAEESLDQQPPPAFEINDAPAQNSPNDEIASQGTAEETPPILAEAEIDDAPTSDEPDELNKTVSATRETSLSAPPPMGMLNDPSLSKKGGSDASLSKAFKQLEKISQDVEEDRPSNETTTTQSDVAIPIEQQVTAPKKSNTSSKPAVDTSSAETTEEKAETSTHEEVLKSETSASIIKQEDSPMSPPISLDNSATYMTEAPETVAETAIESDAETDLEEVSFTAPIAPSRVSISELSEELQQAAGLEIRNLGKSYKRRPVLQDVSLKVKRGEAVGLLGPNGAGKTTCFYMVCGLIPVDVGQVTLDGQDITSLPMYRRARMGIGYLPQEASIFRGLTVEQNIRAVLEAVEKNRDAREAQLESLLDEFSITHLRRSPSVALSGGERRRLEIARALATQPHFILLDEPLAGIDPIAVRDIRELVSHLKNRGLGVLITDHNVRETLGIVDRAYILHDGRVLMEGKPDEIVGNEEVRRVYLGDEFSR